MCPVMSTVMMTARVHATFQAFFLSLYFKSWLWAALLSGFAIGNGDKRETLWVY